MSDLSKRPSNLPPATHVNLGKLFRLLRIRAGLSLRQAGTMTGIGATRLSSIELGWDVPTEEEVRQLRQWYLGDEE